MDSSSFIEIEGPTKEKFRVSKRLLRAILNAEQFLTEQAGQRSNKSRAVVDAPPPKKRRNSKPVSVAAAAQPSAARKDVEENLHQCHLKEVSREDLAVAEDPASVAEKGVDDTSVVQTVSTDQSINSSPRSSRKRKAAISNTAIFLGSPPTKRLVLKKAQVSGSNSRERFNAAKWESMFQQLTRFHQAKGHCRVPRKSNLDRLERWVRTQREEMKKIAQGEHSSRLNPERIEKLNSLGFSWNGSSKA